MSAKSIARAVSAAGILVFAVACGDSTPTQPELDLQGLPIAGGEIDIIIGDPTDPNAPVFSLSSLPGTVEAGHAWSRTINVDAQEHSANVQVDYGDGGGVRSVGYNSVFPSESGTFALSHTYANAGTYLVKVRVSNSFGNRTASATITVTADQNLYIDNFTIDSPIKAGWPSTFSFDARGPGDPAETLYEWSVTYGTGLTHQGFIPPGGTRERTYTWKDPGTYELRIEISNGERSRVLTRQITVEESPISIEDFFLSPEADRGENAQFRFKLMGPGSGPYHLSIDYGDGTVIERQRDPGDSWSEFHVWPESGIYPVAVTISADGLETVSRHGVIKVLRPRPSIVDLVVPATTFVGQETSVTFQAVDSTEMEVETGDYKVWVVLSDGTQVAGQFTDAKQRAVDARLTWHEAGEYDVVVMVGSDQNDLLLVDTVQTTIQVVEQTCQPGTYKDGFDCVDAPEGTYVSGEDAPEPTLCAPGTYQDQTGQTSCIPAPPGSFVAFEGAAQAELCAAGTFQDAAGATSCNDAPAGRFVDVTGAQQATPCAAGTFQAAQGSTTCDDAPAGSFVSGSGATSAQFCAPGTFSANAGQTTCDAAPVGRFVSDAGQAQATACSPGYYQDQIGQTSCNAAPAGYFVSVSGAAQATACTEGTYQGATAATSCDVAAPGHFVAFTGASSESPCALGTYQPDAGQANCLAAPLGSYVDVTGAAATRACPDATSTDGVGSTSASDCVAVGKIAIIRIDKAIQDRTLVPADETKGGRKQFDGWVGDLKRSTDFLEGPQKQAGCSGFKNALKKADGQSSPKDVVKGPARASTAKDLEWVIEKNSCKVGK